MTSGRQATIAAVVFDMDGVLLDSEQVWDEVRERLVRERGGHWHEGAQRAMMGMSSPEWSRYLADELATPGSAEELNDEVVRRMQGRYRQALPLIDGAVEAVSALARHWPLGLASSSNRPLIDAAIDAASLSDAFAVTVSSEEVARGKPAPDVYLEAASRLGLAPAACVAVEDSSNGLLSAAAAGMRVIAIPNPHYPPAPHALARAAARLASIGELTPSLVASLA